MIAMALISRPALVIADEPTTALDVTTQAQILDLLKELKESLGTTLLFITHDLGVVAEIADNVIVMQDGDVVEAGPVKEIFHRPKDDYTKKLLTSLPGRWGDDGPGATTSPADEPVGEAPLLELRNLTMRFETVAGKLFGRRSKESVTAVNDVSLSIPQGKTIGIVGESGCGKTTLGRMVLRAYQPTAGEMLYRRADGDIVDLAKLSNRELLGYRRDIRMVFQDPYGSLNPRMTVQEVIAEPLVVVKVPKSEIRDRVHDVLRKVGLESSMAARYPHAFSGGQRQRISIARAVITSPRLVVADEAVSALDASVRTQVLELMGGLQEELDLTYLFISHDLSVVEQLCDEVAVMYFGEMVEHRPTAELFANPQHDYTRALLSAVPVSDPEERGTKKRIVYRRKQDATAT
ncbi:MAG: ABC transporter ATP-binding protein, partial [Propionibacterium sp.]|nr:ABC transporter ATP-binding protein [Propionibacterium sp.]